MIELKSSFYSVFSQEQSNYGGFEPLITVNVPNYTRQRCKKAMIRFEVYMHIPHEFCIRSEAFLCPTLPYIWFQSPIFYFRIQILGLDG
jgi:hypothetical protein